MKRSAWIGLAAVAVLGGCAAGRIERPAGYVQIEPGPQYDVRYISADDNVLATRTLANAKGGTLEFWTKAVERQMTASAGYRLAEQAEIKTGRLDGTLFDFRVQVGGIEHTYLVGLFVQGDRIMLVEAGGRSEAIKADREKLLAAIRSLS